MKRKNNCVAVQYVILGHTHFLLLQSYVFTLDFDRPLFSVISHDGAIPDRYVSFTHEFDL